MKKNIYVMIRYSVLTSGKNAWVIGKDKAEEEYKERLFSRSRLDVHEFLFENITLPSVVAAKSNTEVNVRVLVFTSELLPEEYMQRLKSIVSQYTDVDVIPLPTDATAPKMMNDFFLGMLSASGEPECYATVRLDDDDALSVNFFKMLEKYINPSLNGYAVSFAKGIRALLIDNKYAGFEKVYYPKCAQGLAHVTVYRGGNHKPRPISVFALGNHTKVDEKFPVIVDASFYGYVRTVHSESDVYGVNKQLSAFEGKGVELREIALAEFELSPAIIT